MAIQSEANFFGAAASQAYSRISSINLEANRAVVQVLTWFNAQAAQKILDANGHWDGRRTAQPPIGGFPLELVGESLARLVHFQVVGGPNQGDNLQAQAYRLLMEAPQMVHPLAV